MTEHPTLLDLIQRCPTLDVTGTARVARYAAHVRKKPGQDLGRLADTGCVLELRPNCECCDRDLDPASADVFICTYECTWCRDCAENVLLGTCPNCGGELVRRPVRPAHLLKVNPPSAKRVVRPGCAAPAAR